MATEIIMPRLSDSMEEGTILKWLKKPGDEVARGEDLVEIETDKANMTYESDADGVLVEIVAEEGETLPIGEVIARVGAPSEAGKPDSTPPTPGREAEEVRAGSPDSAPTSVPDSPRQRGGGDGRVKASPLARRMAREQGIDIASLEGSGPGGRIIKVDVERASEGAPARRAEPVAAEPEPEREKVSEAPPPEPAKAAEPERRPSPETERPPAPEPTRAAEPVETAKGEVETVELTKLQQTVARRMAESKATAPHFYLSADIDMSEAVALRGRLKQLASEGTPVPSFNDMVVKACALALRDHPRANGAYRDGRIELYSRINVGVAVAAQDALVVPTVFDADQRSLGDIARVTRQLIARVRGGSITPPELSGGTFTVSNLGMYGISNFQAVINPPQAGILAVGELKKRPVASEGGEVVVRDLMSVNLACDHRILYGADGAEFLARIRQFLEEPFSLAV